MDDYKKYLPIFEELVEHVRSRQHEFDNKLMALRALPITYSDYNSLSAALTDNIAQALDSTKDHSLLKLNSKVLSAFLFAKAQQAEKKGIHIDYIIKNANIQTICPEHELLEIAGILIDNAIEAVNSNEHITVTIDSKENRFCISTLNKGPIVTPELRVLFFQKSYTTKTATSAKLKRGTGLCLLKSITDEYHGEILLDNVTLNNTTHIEFEVTI